MQMNLASKNDLKVIKAWSHGGSAFKKRRKIRRPLIVGKSTHVVMKSVKAKGSLSFYKHQLLVSSLLKSLARKHFVTIQDYVNMGNHLHLKVKFKDITHFQNFIRTFAALAARKITGAAKGNRFGRFWDGLVFTRVLRSKYEELGLKGYFEGNHRERELGYQERSLYLKNWNNFIYSLKKTRAGPKEALA